MDDIYNEINALIVSLENEVGEILLTEEKGPRVYYLTAQQDGEPFATEYYAVADTPVISPEAKEHGRCVSGWWLFSMQDDTSGWRIIDYELGRYRV